MKIELVVDSKGHHLVLIPETNIEKAFAMLAGHNKTQSSVKRQNYTAIGAGPATETAIVVTLTNDELSAADAMPNGGGAALTVEG
jgi:hypothetical protein